MVSTTGSTISDGLPRESGAVADDVGRRVAGRYLIERLAGQGGMGYVFVARDLQLGRRVALKRMRPELARQPRARRRFVREARSAARLNHPSLVQIHDILIAEGVDWIVMEWLEGCSLKTRLGLSRGDELATVLQWVHQIAGGLECAHDRGIVHRDLKSENVLVTSTGEIKVLDFGLAKPMEEPAAGSTEGRMVGTPRVMAPEQVRGEAVDARTDLFALGVLMYELISGESPFLGPDAVATFARVCSHRQPPLSDRYPALPGAVSLLVDRLLAKDPAQRPADATAVKEELAGLLAGAMADDGRQAQGAAHDATPTTASDTDLSSPGRSADGFRLTGERRPLAVVLCELVDAVQDLESSVGRVPVFQHLILETMERFGGRVAENQGHRSTILFGDLTPRHDDVQRAVRAATAARGAVSEAGLELRAAVHCGWIRSRWDLDGRREGSSDPLLGDLVDGAQELMDSGGSGVALSPATRRWLPEGEAAEPLRLDSAATIRTCIGRRRELGLLNDRWRLTQQGQGQTVVVSSERGMGKTFLIDAFRRRVAATGTVHDWIDVRGLTEQRRRPFGALMRGILESSAIDGVASPDRLEQYLTQYFSETVPPDLMASVHRYLRGETADQQHVEVLDFLTAWVEAASGERPVVVAVDDSECLDALTLRWLDRLIESCQQLSLLIVLAEDPAGPSGISGHARATRLDLGPIQADSMSELVEATLGSRRSPQGKERIRQLAQGVPWFAAELCRGDGVEEIDDSDGGRLPIPPAVWVHFAAQLDRSGPSKELVMTAALLGRRFTGEQLVELLDLERHSLDTELDRLVERRLLRRTGAAGSGEFSFHYELGRRAVAACLLPRDRRALLRRRSRFSRFEAVPVDRNPGDHP